MLEKSSYKFIPEFITKFILIGHARSIKIKKNIIISFLLKGIMIIIGFIRVPLILNYLEPEKYGIWLTLGSVIAWFAFFDIGLGNGLRNKLAEALAKDDKDLARTYVSTTYAILFIIIGVFYLVFLFINPSLDWTKILNTSDVLANKLTILAFIVVTFFSLRFVLNLVGIVLISDQKPAVQSFLSASGSLIYLIILYLLTKTTSGSLLYIGIASGISPTIVLILASLFFYKRKYEYLRPSIKYVDFKYFKDLGTLGIQFFILQISALIIFSTDNMIITQVLGPENVVPYNIAHRYIGVISMGFGIIMWPFWSAYTEAYVKDDIKWIKNTTRKLIKIWGLAFVGVVFLIIISSPVYHFWVGDKVEVPLLLSIGMGLFVLISQWNNIFVFFINGVGKIRLQLLGGIFIALINIPVSIYFAKNLGMGAAGVIFGTCFSLIFPSILMPIQYYKIVNKKARGIWNK